MAIFVYVLSGIYEFDSFDSTDVLSVHSTYDLALKQRNEYIRKLNDEDEDNEFTITAFELDKNPNYN